MADVCQDSLSVAQSEFLASEGAQDLTHQQHQEENSEEGEKKRLRRPANYIRRRPVKIYADNFGFGVNGYQCMIDYLDAKDSGVPCSKRDLRLPLLEDRCLDSYNARKPFKLYENCDIDDYILKGTKIRDQIRQNDVATSGNVLNRTHTNWSMTKKYVQLVKKSNVVDYRKLREQAELESQGIILPPGFNSIGTKFVLESMDPFNLTLYKAHNNLDHAIYMNARRERLSGINDQLDGVVGQLSEKTDDLNQRCQRELRARNRKNVITAYDNAQSLAEVAQITEDLAARNKLRRQLEFQALEDGVDDIMRNNSGRNRFYNNLRALNDTISTMDDDINAMRRRHREEQIASDMSADVIRADARRKARQVLNLDICDEDVSDPEYARLKIRRTAPVVNIPTLDDDLSSPARRYRPESEIVSDVHSRVLQRAGEIAGQTSTHRHVNNRARYINIYVPRHNTADPNLIVKPTRTEMNIDYMAKCLATKGRMQRRYDVDDEADLPVSNLNTYSRAQYVNKEAMKPVDQVPSNSLRVRSAVCRARQRNALQGR